MAKRIRAQPLPETADRVMDSETSVGEPATTERQRRQALDWLLNSANSPWRSNKKTIGCLERTENSDFWGWVRYPYEVQGEIDSNGT